MPPNQPQAVATKPVIVLTGGGSGGHITPLLSLARALKKAAPNCLIAYIGLKGDKLDRLQDEYAVFDEVYYVSSGKFRRYHGESLLSHLLDIKTLFLNSRDFFKVFAGIMGSYRILKRIKPGVVFSKGGFVAVPVGISARIIGYPIITHDSDTVPGLANRILGRWAVIHATGMPDNYYKYPKETIRYVGIPLNSQIVPVDEVKKKEYRTELGISADKKVVLVSGGGNGAESLNEMVLGMSEELFKSTPETVIVHFAGSSLADELQKAYRQKLDANLQQNITVMGFSPDFYKYSGASDLVITRAGATTLAELAVQGKACIVIPSPFLTGGHQVKNAHQLKEKGAVEVLPNNATPHELWQKTDSLLKDDDYRRKLAETFSKTARTNASGELAQILLETAGNKDNG